MRDEKNPRLELLEDLKKLHEYIAESNIGLTEDTLPCSSESSLDVLNIVNQSSMVLFRWRNEPQWPIAFVTENVKDLLGYSADELISDNRNFLEFIHQEDLPIIEKSLQRGESGFFLGPCRMIQQWGEVLWIEGNVELLKDDQGQVAGYHGVIYDITHHHATEEALRESEYRLKEAGKLAGLGYWQWDIATGEVLWSEEVYDIFHLDRESFTPRIDSIMKLSPWPEYNQRDQELIQKAIDTREKGEYDQKFLRPDGSVGYYHSTFKGEYREDGTLEMITGTVMDITEQILREEELRKLRNYLSNIINSMPSILIAVDSDGRVTQWNHPTEKATGIPCDDAQAQPLTKVFPRLGDEMDQITRSIKERRVISSSRVERADDHDKHFDAITIYPLISNGVEGAVIRVDDVTEQVRLEEMMVQSEKMLSVGGLAAGMAHEINNPLAGMMQTADVMKARLTNLEIPANRRAADEVGFSLEQLKAYMEKREIVRMVETIHESGIRVASIVDNMLSFARKSEAQVSDHHVEEIIDKTVELAGTDYDLKREYDFKKIKIRREYLPDIPVIPCEKAKIQQVLLNLLRNGAQAMQAGGTSKPQFILRTGFDPNDRMVVVEVEDNGPGMNEEVSKRVFEPFFTSKPAGIGTGLGLSVSYFIITEHHKGKMTVESTPGSGTIFKIKLPVNRDEG